MAYVPTIDRARLAAPLEELAQLRQELEAVDILEPLARWLRRQVEARGAHMSTSIEGNPMTEAEVQGLFARHRETLDRAERENLDYRDAARFARQVANDFKAEVDAGLIRAMHFLVVRTTYPWDSAAQWRQQQNRVADANGRTVYMPPPPGEVAERMDDLVLWLRTRRMQEHPLILAAVAHLEFVNIHPFDDGNGRVARALTTYFTEWGGWGLRGFVSSEAVFGRDRQSYYRALADAGARYEERSRDITAWCEWVLRRFSIEVATAVGVVERWRDLFADAPQSAWSSAFVTGYTYLAVNGSASRAEYVAATRLSPATAVKQLNFMVDSGFARRVGQGRATRYVFLDSTAADYANDAYAAALERFPEP
ncbi:MAG: hypothetical protein AMXMBFR23_24890 [Chloroflexota bacterium]